MKCFQTAEEAIANMSTVGFPVGIQEVLPSGGEILHTFFSINSGTSNNIKKDESIYISYSLHYDMYF